MALRPLKKPSPPVPSNAAPLDLPPTPSSNSGTVAVDALPKVQWVDATRPAIHCVVYGESGARKSSFVATFPKPMLVLGFDPYGKMTPYMRGGIVEKVTDDPFYQAIPVRMGRPSAEVSVPLPMSRVRDAAGNLLVQIEHYAEPDPESPIAYQQLLSRAPYLSQEYDQWGTIVLDSLTFCELASLRWHQYLNPDYREPRKWYAEMAEDMTNLILARLAWATCNVVVVAHTTASDDKEEYAEGVVRTLMAVGKNTKKIPAGFDEVYHARARRVTEGTQRGLVVYELQTRLDNLFAASSQIHAPDPCAMTYEALWANYE